MTYDIPYGPTVDGGLLPSFCIALVIIGVVVALVITWWKVDPPLMRLGIAIVILFAGASGFSLSNGWLGQVREARQEAREQRTIRVERSWDLDAADASYLVERIYYPDAGWKDRAENHQAFITLADVPANAYLLRQGDRLSLIVDDKPVPVVTR